MSETSTTPESAPPVFESSTGLVPRVAVVVDESAEIRMPPLSRPSGWASTALWGCMAFATPTHGACVVQRAVVTGETAPPFVQARPSENSTEFSPLVQRASPEYRSDAPATDPQPRDTAESRALAGILSALDEDPIEDGVTHSAESALNSYVSRFGSLSIAHQFLAVTPSARAAAFLRLLGRCTNLAPGERRSFVQWGLASDSVEVRDAAIQAVENWEDGALIDVLRRHAEPVAWLAKYTASVVRDLGG